MADYGLLDIMPENLLEDKHIREITEVIDAALKDLYPKTSYPALFSRIDELDSDTIDSLAWQCHVDFYDEDLPLEVRRELVKKSIDYHRHMGTNYAVEGVVNTCFPDAVIHENWEYGGDPYCFKVTTIDSAVPSEAGLNRIFQAINSVKNARSHLDAIGFIRYLDNNLYFGGGPSLHKRITISPAEPTDQTNYGQTYVGSAMSQHIRYEVSMKPPTNHEVQKVMYFGGGAYRHKKFTVGLEPPTDHEVQKVVNFGGGVSIHKYFTVAMATEQEE